LALASPFFKTLPLAKHGLEWIHPPAAVGHPLDDGTAAVLELSLERTSAALGPDARAYTNVFAPLIRNAVKLIPEILAPPVHPLRHPLMMMRFGINAIQSAQKFTERHFKGERARALF